MVRLGCKDKTASLHLDVDTRRLRRLGDHNVSEGRHCGRGRPDCFCRGCIPMHVLVRYAPTLENSPTK